jgi:hypothetical protein
MPGRTFEMPPHSPSQQLAWKNYHQPRPQHHVVMFSGGIGSYVAAKRVAERYGTDRLTLIFTDTLIEDQDLYRFLSEAARNIGGEFVHLKEGRTIWGVFRDERFLGNSKIDPCSKILKREMADRWLRENRDPRDTIVYVGIDWTEEHRYIRLRDLRRAEGWTYAAPLCEAPYISKKQMFETLCRDGIAPPRLYALGFAHNNCGGGCVKAGMGHFAHLLNVLPEVFAEWEMQEEDLRKYLGRDDISILLDRRGGRSKPMTLTDLRARVESGEVMDKFEIGGCGCFSDVEN